MLATADRVTARRVCPAPNEDVGARDATAGPLMALCDFYGGSTPAEAMAAACGQLLQRARQLSPPTRLRVLSDALGVTIHETLQSREGALRLRRGTFVIEVSPDWPWTRRRFTIAHELGHVLVLRALARDRLLLEALKRPAIGRRVEELCDQAAAELLMPRSDFLQVGEQRFCGEGLAQLCSRYGASLEAVLVRFTEVLAPASVTVWSRHVRPNDGPRTFRATRSFGRDRRLGFWTGMSASRLSPDLVAEAYVRGEAGPTMLTTAGRDDVDAWGLAARLPVRGSFKQLRLPRAAPKTAVDGQLHGDVALLLMAPRHLVRALGAGTSDSAHTGALVRGKSALRGRAAPSQYAPARYAAASRDGANAYAADASRGRTRHLSTRGPS